MSKKDEYYEVYDSDEESDDDEDVEGIELVLKSVFSDEYDDVYTEDGDIVTCDFCGEEIKWKNGEYVCLDCGQEMSRDVFFNYIGAEPPGDKCITCNELYPGCMYCPHGYIKEDE